MKLGNRTKFDTNLLKEVLIATAKKAHARYANVVVQINPAKRFGGYIMPVSAVNWQLPGIKPDLPLRIDLNQEMIIMKRHSTDFGAMRIRLKTDHASNFMAILHLIKMLLHEWKHIADLQHNLKFDTAGFNSRRMTWKNRPEEIRAINFTDKHLGPFIDNNEDLVERLSAEYSRMTNKYWSN